MKKKKTPLNRFDPGTRSTTLQYLLTWSTQVNILWVALYYIISNCKQNITWLSLFVGTIVPSSMSIVFTSFKNLCQSVLKYPSTYHKLFIFARQLYLQIQCHELSICLSGSCVVVNQWHRDNCVGISIYGRICFSRLAISNFYFKLFSIPI